MRRTRSALTWVTTSVATVVVALGAVALTSHPSRSVPSSHPTSVTTTTGAPTTTQRPSTPPTTVVRYGGDDGASYAPGGSAPAYGDN